MCVIPHFNKLGTLNSRYWFWNLRSFWFNYIGSQQTYEKGVLDIKRIFHSPLPSLFHILAPINI